MVMETKPKKHNRQYGADPSDPSSSLFVQPNDEVVPISESVAADGTRSAEFGEPILAKELWKEGK